MLKKYMYILYIYIYIYIYIYTCACVCACICMYVCIYDTAKSNETYISGNKTVTRGQRIENGYSKVCFCKDDDLMCKSKCLSNKTIDNQHDRVVLTGSRYDF